MNQRIKLSQGIEWVWPVLALLIFLLIWPLDVIKTGSVSKSGEVVLSESHPITVENNGTQMFIAQGNFLKAVELFVANDMVGETITFRVYDGAYIQLWETFHVVEEGSEFPGFLRIPVELEMQEGWEYYYTVEGLTKELILYYEDLFESTSFANGTLLYGGQEMPGLNLIARYHYTESLPWWGILLSGVCLALAAAGLRRLTRLLFYGKLAPLDREMKVQRFLQWVLNPCLGLLTLAALLAVFPGRAFGVGIINYAFYDLGILIAAGVGFYGINHKRRGNAPLVPLKAWKEKIPLFAMSVCFTGALWACCEYMNGLYDIHHSYATCKLLTWVALAVICTFEKKELFTVYNLIYAVAAPVAGYFYAKPYAEIPEQDVLYRLQARLLVVGGFVLLQMVVSLFKMLRNRKGPDVRLWYPYAGFLTLLLALLVLFRNTRTWILVLVILFGLFYLRMWMWEKRDLLLSVFGNALVLHFITMVVYCLLHRPYLRHKFHRYGMYYHTVTMTGYYLALVLCAILVRVFLIYLRKRRWKDAWKELVLLGTGNVYLFLTLSRTGYLAAVVMELFVIFFLSFIYEKKRLQGALKAVALVLGISICLFPAVFTLQRILPAIYNDPIYSEIEESRYITRKGEATDSEAYIDIIAFVKVMNNKLFGVDTGNLSLSSIFEQLQPVYRKAEGRLLASMEPEMEEESDFSNGRIEIFREYIKHWNLEGHELMGVPLADGSMAVHAHNTFLQAIHDHGLITGIGFLLFGIFTFAVSTLRYFKEKNSRSVLILIPAVTLAFAAAGMVEWVYHLCNPFGFSVMVVVTPLLFGKKKKTG